MRIAYVEDDSDQAALLSGWLRAAGHSCHHFDRGRALQRALASESFDLYLLDWHLPDVDGLEVLSSVRTLAPHAPVIFTTVRDKDEDIARALEAGADDYISKPVHRAELLARIHAVTRRLHGTPPAEVLEASPYRVNRGARTVECEGRRIELTDKEYALAEFLFLNGGKVVSRQHLLEAVWGLHAKTQTRTVDTHMSRLRTKLGLAGEHGWRLRSVHQFGYRLERLESGPDKS